MAEQQIINQRQSPHQPLWVEVRSLVPLFVWAVALVLTLWFFKVVELVLLGLLAAGCVAALLEPLVSRMPGPRPLAAVTVGLTFILVTITFVALLTYLLIEPVREQFTRWPEIERGLNELLITWSRRLRLSQTITVGMIGNQLVRVFQDTDLPTLFASTADTLIVIGIVLAFIYIGSIFILLEPPGRLLNPVIHLLPRQRQEPARAAFHDLVPSLRKWLLGTFLSMSVIGVAEYIGYTIIGLNFALPLALFGAIAEIVPTIGPTLTLLLALLVAATQGPFQIVGVIVVYAVVQSLESNLLIPIVMRGALHLPPLVTLFTIVLWSKVFGFAGLLLALPINVVIWSFLDHLVIRPQLTISPPGEQ